MIKVNNLLMKGVISAVNLKGVFMALFKESHSTEKVFSQ